MALRPKTKSLRQTAIWPAHVPSGLCCDVATFFPVINYRLFRDRLTGSPQSGHTSSSCGSPPTAAPTDSLTAPSCLANFAAAAAVGWPLIDAQGTFLQFSFALFICENIDLQE